MLINYENVDIYQEDTCILNNVCFHAEEGEFIYIIGKVGSGKSSLLKTLYCELDVETNADCEQSKAEILGYDLTKIKRKEIPSLRRELGIIFQDFQLLHDKSVCKNLEFVLKATGWKDKKDIATRIDEVLKLVEMEHKKDKMPHELSGGEQQRVSIARALAKNPKILLCDEPTGALDSETGVLVLKLLLSMAKNYGKTIVVVTHNQNIAKMADVVIRVKNGKIKSYEKQENPMSAEEVEW